MTDDITNEIKGFIEFLQKQKLDNGKTNLLTEKITLNMLFKNYFIYSKGKSIWVFEKSIFKTMYSFRIFAKDTSPGNFVFGATNYDEFLKCMGLKK